MGISYVVTCYNKAAYLEDCLASIATERRASGGEIIIVDDGSTDGSSDILAGFAAAQPDVRILAQANQGVVVATNRGFGAARCAAIRFCDADDLLTPGSSQVLLAALAGSGADIAYGRHDTYRSKPGNRAAPVTYGGATLLERPLRSALRRNLFSPSSTLLTRDICHAIFPLPPGYRTSQDYMIGLRACFCARIARIDAPLSLGPEHGENRLSADPGRMYAETARFLAGEIRDHPQNWRDSDAGFALKRNAGRALLWARRNGRPARQQLKLLALKYAAPWRDRHAAARALGWIAAEVYGLR